MANLIEHPMAIVISDVHVGDPTNERLDDFDQDEEFERLLSQVIPEEAGGPATLIINGDFIDFPQVLPELGKHDLGRHFGVTEEQSVDKINRVIAGHPRVFESLKSYLAQGGQVIVVPGNHDVDLHWPPVFEALRTAAGGIQSPQLCFVKNGEIDEQRLHIEHGNQYSFDNRFENWKNPIIKAPDGSQRLERSWGTFFMDLIYNEIEDTYPFINQVHPAQRLAWIALSNFRDDERISAGVIGELLLFFFLHGKRYLGEHLLGVEEEEIAPENIEELLHRLGTGGSRKRFDLIIEETIKLIPPTENSLDPSQISTMPGQLKAKDYRALPGLLGKNDKRGMEKRQRELLKTGEIDIVVFGHTHAPIDGNHRPVWGEADPRREFNTGSWTPALQIRDDESPRWEDLNSYPRINDIRYLRIHLASTPRAYLQHLCAH